MGLSVVNRGARPITVQAIRLLDATGTRRLDLAGPDSAIRVYSDSFSVNRPVIRIMNLDEAPGGTHRGSWSQLVYNRESHLSLFTGALSANRLLTPIHLVSRSRSPDGGSVSEFTIDSTGTTEVQNLSTLHNSPPADRIELNLPVAPGANLAAEPTIFMSGTDYHEQLETYGQLVRDSRHARVSAPNLLGWWSWTAFYSAIIDGRLLTNAAWLSAHLRDLGYEFFHVDEGYMYARGEYATPDAARFPNGMIPVTQGLSG